MGTSSGAKTAKNNQRETHRRQPWIAQFEKSRAPPSGEYFGPSEIREEEGQSQDCEKSLGQEGGSKDCEENRSQERPQSDAFGRRQDDQETHCQKDRKKIADNEEEVEQRFRP
jgi:hypothetical protein